MKKGEVMQYIFPLWNCVYTCDGKENSGLGKIEHNIHVVACTLAEAQAEAERITGMKGWIVADTIVPILGEGRHCVL